LLSVALFFEGIRLIDIGVPGEYIRLVYSETKIQTRSPDAELTRGPHARLPDELLRRLRVEPQSLSWAQAKYDQAGMMKMVG